jgi:hypothetical protein
VLHLVPPPDAAPAKRRRNGVPSRVLSLTPEEIRHLFAAVTAVARTFPGGKSGLARALGLDRSTLNPGRKHPGPGLAVALWRLTGMPLDVILSGKLAAVPSPPRGPDHAA